MGVRRALAAILLAVFTAAPAAAEPMTLTLGHVGSPGSLFHIAADEFARRINRELAGRVHLNAFGSSQLGKDKELLQKLKLGTLDIALPSTVMSTVAAEFGLFEMPYLVKSRAHMRAIERDVFWPKLAPAAEAKGYVILAVWENGFRHVTNDLRPINTPQDLKGIKLRTPNGIWRVKMFRAYGANPTPMAFSEVFTALQTGVIDGQENPFAQLYSAKFHEVQKYLSLTGHVYTPAYVTVGKRKWAKMPADLGAAIEKIARDMQGFVHRTAAELDIDLLQKLKDGGMVVNQPDRAAFIAANGPIYDEFSDSVAGAAEMIEAARAAEPKQ